MSSSSEKRELIIPLLRRLWWVIILGALVGWSTTLTYFTIWPPETALERDIRTRAAFLEPKQAADLDEAADLLNTVNARLRQLPRNQTEYLFIKRLLANIDKWDSPEVKEALLKRARKIQKNATLKDIEGNWIQKTMTILALSEDERPKDLDEAAEKLRKRRGEIERENDSGFNSKLDDLIYDLIGRETQNKQDLIKRVNKFLAGDVVEAARERLILAGTPALPYLVALLEEDTNETKRKHLYDVVLYIIACTRAQSLTSADIERISGDLRREYGEEPDDDAVAKLRDWLDSPGNRELLGK